MVDIAFEKYSQPFSERASPSRDDNTVACNDSGKWNVFRLVFSEHYFIKWFAGDCGGNGYHLAASANSASTHPPKSESMAETMKMSLTVLFIG